MKTYNLSFKKTFFCIISYLFFSVSQAQPTVFTWNNRHGFDYISSAKDQKEQGPCGIFATVAAAEAMVQIYFNTTGSDLNLSESNLYSSCGIAEFPAPQALAFILSDGVIDDAHWPFPNEYVNNPPWQYYLPSPDCEEYDSYSLKVKIPKWGYSIEANPTLTINNNEDLKKAIMDYGPIIVMGDGADQTGSNLGRALHPSGANVNHTVLVTGWNSTNGLQWEIKDSWPGAISDQRLVGINFFDYDPHFYCIYPVYDDNGTLKYITVKNSADGDVYAQSNAVDIDKDGFFRWGLEAYPPSGFTGFERMDYDDSDPDIIFLNGYNPLPAPFISDTTSKYVCSGGKYFTLNNFSTLSQLGFTVQWNVTPNYFTSSTTGYTATAFVNPVSSYTGKKCKIEYYLKYDGNTIKTYKFEFIINGPLENLVSTSVLDSYGGSAQGSDDFYYICPNTNYTIYYNNYDYSCNTSNFSWTLPYGWTENYSYLHYISINTNDYPYGYLQIYANTCCGSSVNVKNIYFSEAECGEYFIVYPNPSNSFVDINIIKEKLPSLDYISNESCSVTIIDKSGIIKLKVNFKGFPYRLNFNNLPDGLYFLIIQIKDIKSTTLISIQH